MYGVQRLEKQVQYLLSQALLKEARNPLLQRVTITKVKISSDRAHGKVYVSCLGEEGEQKKILAALRRAKGFLQGVLARNLQIRRIPDLTFHFDSSIEKSIHYEALFQKIRQEFEEQEAEAESHTESSQEEDSQEDSQKRTGEG